MTEKNSKEDKIVVNPESSLGMALAAALIEAVREGNEAAALALVDAGAPLAFGFGETDAGPAPEYTLSSHCARRGMLRLFDISLEGRVPVPEELCLFIGHACARAGSSPEMDSARAAFVEAMVGRGGDPNAPVTGGGWRPMHLAAAAGLAGVCSALERLGAEPSALSMPENSDATPIYPWECAHANGHLELGRLLRAELAEGPPPEGCLLERLTVCVGGVSKNPGERLERALESLCALGRSDPGLLDWASSAALESALFLPSLKNFWMAEQEGFASCAEALARKEGTKRLSLAFVSASGREMAVAVAAMARSPLAEPAMVEMAAALIEKGSKEPCPELWAIAEGLRIEGACPEPKGSKPVRAGRL